MKKLLFNPFEKYDGRALLAIGLVATLIGSMLGYSFNARFDGVIDMHFTYSVPFAQPFTDNVFNIAILFFTLHLYGFIINNKTRPADVLGTVMLARLPFYLGTFFNLNNYMARSTEMFLGMNMNNIQINTSDIILIVVAGLVSIVLLVWYITLLYNGFKTATNLKTTNQKVLFAVTLLVAEILSKILFFIIN